MATDELKDELKRQRLAFDFFRGRFRDDKQFTKADLQEKTGRKNLLRLTGRNTSNLSSNQSRRFSRAPRRKISSTV